MFVKPHLLGLSDMTYGQTNEMMWAVHHHVPMKEVMKKHNPASFQKAQKRTQKEMRGKIHKNFWYLYGNATRGVDKRAEVTPLSWFSPAALQKFWNDNVGPMSLKLAKEVHILDKSLKLAKEVHILDKYRKKLPTVKEANKKDHRIPSSSAPATQSPPAS